jgi:prevent-host-death family protein
MVTKREAASWLAQFAKSGKPAMKQVPLSEIKDDLSRYLREAETREIVITRHGKPAGVLIVSKRRKTGLTIASKTIPGFCAASSRHAAVYAPDTG